MKKVVVAVLLLLAAAPGVRANDRVGPGMTARTATVAPRTGFAVPAVAKLQPVVGSVQRTSHFTNPLTHKAKYKSTVYNPVLGSFGTYKFRR